MSDQTISLAIFNETVGMYQKQVALLEDRISTLNLQINEWRTKADFERARWHDEQSVWLATRDANKELHTQLEAAKAMIAVLDPRKNAGG